MNGRHVNARNTQCTTRGWWLSVLAADNRRWLSDASVRAPLFSLEWSGIVVVR